MDKIEFHKTMKRYLGERFSTFKLFDFVDRELDEEDLPTSREKVRDAIGDLLSIEDFISVQIKKDQEITYDQK